MKLHRGDHDAHIKELDWMALARAHGLSAELARALYEQALTDTAGAAWRTPTVYRRLLDSYTATSPRMAPGKSSRTTRLAHTAYIAKQAPASATNSPTLMRHSVSATASPTWNESLDSAVHSGGEPLPESLRLRMERSLGASFAEVRIHTDDHAAQAALAASAHAFTLGNHIFFAHGAWDPDSGRGLELLAHELAHVVQWQQGRIHDARPEAPFSRESDPLEREAHATAQHITRTPAHPGGETAPARARNSAPPAAVDMNLAGATRLTAMRDGDGDDDAAAECGTATPWTPGSSTTLEQARSELGDTPCRTLHGGRIGAYSQAGKYYPLSYQGASYQLIANPARNFFGIKRTSGSSRTSQDIDALMQSRSPEYFNEAQRAVVESVKPHVASEGGIASINTYDNQFLTIAGRGEKFGRVTTMISAAEQLDPHFQFNAPHLGRIRELCRHLGAESPLGTAGPRLDMPEIHELLTLLANPQTHRLMTLAKLNDSILTFYGLPLNRGGRASIYTRDVPAGTDQALQREMHDNHLDESIIGIAIHLSLGASAEFPEPMTTAVAANTRYPQREAERTAHGWDFEQLSRQVAYMIQVRMRNKMQRAGGECYVSQSYFRVLYQKVNDFNNHFRRVVSQEPAEEGESGGRRGRRGGRRGRDQRNFFRMDAVTPIIPCWTGARQVTPSSDRPAEGRIYLMVRSGRGGSQARYYDFGQVEGAAASSQPAADQDQAADPGDAAE